MSLEYLLARTQERLLDYARDVLNQPGAGVDVLKRSLVDAINRGQTPKEQEKIPSSFSQDSKSSIKEAFLLPSRITLAQALKEETSKFEEVLVILVSAKGAQACYLKSLLCLRLNEAFQHLKERIKENSCREGRETFEKCAAALQQTLEKEQRLHKRVCNEFKSKSETCNSGRWGKISDEVVQVVDEYVRLCRKYQPGIKIEEESDTLLNCSMYGSEGGNNTSDHERPKRERSSSESSQESERNVSLKMIQKKETEKPYLDFYVLKEAENHKDVSYLLKIQKIILNYTIDNLMREAKTETVSEQVTEKASQILWSVTASMGITEKTDQQPAQAIITCRHAVLDLLSRIKKVHEDADHQKETVFFEALFNVCSESWVAGLKAKKTPEFQHYNDSFQKCNALAESYIETKKGTNSSGSSQWSLLKP